MEEVSNFVDIFNELAKEEKKDINGLPLYANGVAIWCDNISLDEHTIRCFIGQIYVGSFNLMESLPWFVADDKAFHLCAGKVEIL